MRNAIIVIFVLSATLGCLLGTGAKSTGSQFAKNAAVIFITGNELGMLKPCGCAEGQLGGIGKRAGIFQKIPAAQRLIIDTGNLLTQPDEQGLIKLNILLQAFNLLNYDVLNLTGEDIRAIEMAGLMSTAESMLNIITDSRTDDINLPKSFGRNLAGFDRPVKVTIASFNPETDSPSMVDKLLPKKEGNYYNFNLLIISDYNEPLINTLAEKRIVDCFICPAVSEQPLLLKKLDSGAKVISAGRYGQYIIKLELSRTDVSDIGLNFSAVPVVEQMPEDEALANLYRVYQQIVREAGLLENYPRFTLPAGLSYVGSKTCRHCHAYSYSKWSEKSHADAFATLKNDGSDYDPECVVCHVVGMEYQSGFITEEKTPHLKDVGCEACHGPGSAHIESYGNAPTTEPRMDCVACHTPEHSPEFAGKEAEYREKIIHWPEQDDKNSVEKE